MKNRELFDQYAREYGDTVDEAIRASGYDAAFFADLKAKLVARAVAKANPAMALDFGCGIGATTRALGRALPGAQLVGVDVSPESIAVAEELSAREGTGEAFQVSEGELPFPDGRFDLAFASCVFHHIERDEQPSWIGEIYRVLRPGGRFFLFEHNPYNPLTRRVVSTCPFDEGVTLLSPGYARELVRSAGFSSARPHYYFFFPKALEALRGIEARLSWCPVGAQYYVLGSVPE